MAEIIFLLLAVSIDGFTACAGLGAKQIKLPLLSAVIISGTGALFLFVSLTAGEAAENFLSPEVCKGISFGILFMMGLLNLSEHYLKHFLRKRQGEKSILFSISGIEFALRLYLDEAAADRDNSKSLSPKEAAFLAAALSMDSLVTGLGMGLSKTSPLITAAVGFLTGLIAVFGGFFLGKRLSGKIPKISWAGGIVLIVLAVSRLF